MVGFQQGRILQVSCVPVTVIERIEAFNFRPYELDTPPPQSSINELKRAVSQMGFRAPPLQRKREFRELCRTLRGNKVSDVYYQPFPGLLTLRSSEKSLTELLNMRAKFQGVNASQEEVSRYFSEF